MEKKRKITEQDAAFLMELQKRLNIQDDCEQAEPRFWVIKGSQKRFGIDDGYEDGFELIDNDTMDTVAKNPDEAFGYIRDNVIPELSEKSGIMFEISENEESLYLYHISKDGVCDFEGDFTELIDYLKGYGYHFITANYELEERIYQDTMFITLNSAKNHLERNSYHYSSDAHPYAMTAWRSPEISQLWDILHCVNFDEIESRKTYRLTNRFDTDVKTGPMNVNEIVIFLENLRRNEEICTDKTVWIPRRADHDMPNEIHDCNWQIWCHYFGYDAELVSDIEDKPWYVEEWYDEDIIEAMKDLDIEVTEQSLERAKKAVTGIFDEKSDRNELLKQWIENEFKFDAVELCPYCNQETNMTQMIQKCEHCGEWIVCCSVCDNHSRCGKCEYEVQIDELKEQEKKEKEKSNE